MDRDEDAKNKVSQKACVNCRRSKVKCVHQGEPPCQRCAANNQECKFRLRADDENWREKTDETLSRLASAVDVLINRGGPPAPSIPPQSNGPSHAPPQLLSDSRALYTTTSTSNIRGAVGGSGRLPPATDSAGSDAGLLRQLPLPPPHAAPISVLRDSSLPAFLGYPSRSGASSASPNFAAQFSSHPSPGTRDDTSPRPGLIPASPGDPLTLAPMQTSARASDDDQGPAAKRFKADHPSPGRSTVGHSGSISGPTHEGAMRTRTSSSSSIQQLPASRGGRAEYSSNNAETPGTGIAGASPASQPVAAIPLPMLDANMADQVYAPICARQAALGSQLWRPRRTTVWKVEGSKYARATMDIGRDDPRLTAIGMGIVSMKVAQELIVSFSDRLEAHSFGFATWTAGQNLTPLIISSLLMVSSYYSPSPSTQAYFKALKLDVLETIRPDSLERLKEPLDPEIGIGVEEITGACVAAAWLGGSLGSRLAKIARWWAVSYLANFSVERAVTLGECLTMLPPFRHIEDVDKVRIWLSAYAVNGHHAIMSAQLSGGQDDPQLYVDALRRLASAPSSSHPPSDGTPQSRLEIPVSDRQLAAHASLLPIFLEGRQQALSIFNERAGGGASNAAGKPGHNSSWGTLPHTTKLISLCSEMLVRLEKWSMAALSHEDMSTQSISSLDITLMYHLSRATIVAHGLWPEGDPVNGAVPSASNQERSPESSSSSVVTSEAALRWNLPHLPSYSGQGSNLTFLGVLASAKHSALRAMELLRDTETWAYRLRFLPTWYHYLIGQTCGFLFVLLDDFSHLLLAGEAESIFASLQSFVNTYVAAISAHRLESAEEAHPALSIARLLARSLSVRTS